MTEKALLLICPDPVRAEMIVDHLKRGLPRCEIDVVAGIDSLEQQGFALAIVWMESDHDFGLLAEAQQIGARLGRPIMALAAHYDVAVAIPCFGLGVADYLSLADHRDALVPVVSTLIAGDLSTHPISDSAGPLRPIRSTRKRSTLRR